MDINELTLKSLKNYYSVLKKRGSLSIKLLYQIVVLSFISDLFDNEYSWYITEDNYGVLMRLIDCISKDSCIILTINSRVDIDPIKNFLEDTPVRVSEENIIRLSSGDILRLLNQ